MIGPLNGRANIFLNMMFFLFKTSNGLCLAEYPADAVARK